MVGMTQPEPASASALEPADDLPDDAADPELDGEVGSWPDLEPERVPDAHEPLRSSPRAVPWAGFYNARDLGGLPTRDGGTTASGAFVRSADLRYATAAGIEAAREAGFRTVLDLRNDFETRERPRSPEEVEANAHRIPPMREAELAEGMFAVRVPLDNAGDREFWQRMHAERRLGSPRFFRPVIEEQPDRVVAVLRTIAAAPAGGVIYHCAVGRDRTGLVSFALLALADVEPDAIADDYAFSADELTPFFARIGYPEQKHRIDEALAEIGTTLRESVFEALDGFDSWAALSRAGLTAAELESLRARLRP